MNETGDHPYYPALFKELRRLGYVEGKNLVVARYSGEGREDRYPELCRDVVGTKPDVIVTSASRLNPAGQRAPTSFGPAGESSGAS
jgi:putative ABC transport system substrate-binding protein